MKHYLFFNPNGVALMCSSVPDDIDPATLMDCQFLEVPTWIDAAAVWVRGGTEVVAYTPEQRAAKDTLPAYVSDWDPETGAWVDLRTLADHKANKWDEVKRAREAAEFGGFTWDGSAFDSDLVSQSRVQGAAQLATLAQLGGQAFSIDWTLQDNTVRTLSATDMIAVGQAMGVHIATLHAIGRGKRVEIEAAETVETVQAITW